MSMTVILLDKLTVIFIQLSLLPEKLVVALNANNAYPHIESYAEFIRRAKCQPMMFFYNKTVDYSKMIYVSQIFFFSFKM